MRISMFGVLALSLLTAACGTTGEQRSASAGLTGAGVGALVGGPLGAVVGAAAGGAGGAAMPEGADKMAENALNKQSPSAATAKRAQSALQRQGFYKGKIDGIVGPQTKQAIAAFQQHEGLTQTASLDRATLDRLKAAPSSTATAERNGGANAPASGTSTPPRALSPSELRQRLSQAGYADIAELRRRADSSWDARAQRGDQTLVLHVDGQTGRVIDEHAAAAMPPAPSGSSTSPSPNDSGGSPPATNR